MVSPALQKAAQHHASVTHVKLAGFMVSDFSSKLVKELALEAGIQILHITSVKRTVQDQARIFFNKHVVEKKNANYKNKSVSGIVDYARDMHHKGHSPEAVKTYLIKAIEDVHGGPASVSRHLSGNPFIEIFDIAHYSGPTTGTKRRDYMTPKQAADFLNACRRHIPHSILKLGHSAELGVRPPYEFLDEKCFHFEVRQPVYDKLISNSGTVVA